MTTTTILATPQPSQQSCDNIIGKSDTVELDDNDIDSKAEIIETAGGIDAVNSTIIHPYMCSSKAAAGDMVVDLRCVRAPQG